MDDNPSRSRALPQIPLNHVRVKIPPRQPIEIVREQGPLWGKYTPYVNGFLVLGPDKDIFVCTISALTFLGVILGLQYNVITEIIGVAYAIMGVTIFTLTTLIFVVTSTTDPGVVPKHNFNRNVSAFLHIISFFSLFWTFVQILFIHSLYCTGQGLPDNWMDSDRYKEDIAAGYRLRYCRKCEILRPPRTYHCDLCDVCIRHQDMHLFIGGICIGERNFRQYLFLNFCQVSLAFYLITVNAILLYQTTNKEEAEKISPKDIILTSISFFFGFIILMTPQTGLLMFSYRFYLLAKDRTLREEFRLIKKMDAERHLRKRSGWTNFITTFTRDRNFSSCFHTNLGQVGQIESPLELYMNRHQAYFQSYLPIRYTNSSFVCQNSANYLPSSGNSLRETNRRFYQARRDLSINLRDSAKAKRRGTSTSVPLLSSGELPLIPGDRIRLQKNARPSSSLQRKIMRFQEVQEMPKPFIDFHVHHQLPSSLSEGSIPRTPMTPDVLNEMIQLARATQIRRVIEFVLARDRRGLVRMAQRVDLGGILGIQHGMDPDNLQVIELGGQVQGGQAAAPQAPLPFNLPAGLPQLVAAGLLPRMQSRMARHLTPANLNALRGQNIRDLYRSHTEAVMNSTATARREPIRPLSRVAPPAPPPPDNNRNNSNPRGQRTEAGVIRTRIRRRERRNARAVLAQASGQTTINTQGNEENNNVVVIFVNSQDTLAQPSTADLAQDDMNE